MYSGIIQYHNCWHLEHPTHGCYTQGTKYQKYCGLHRVENYKFLAWHYKANSKFNSFKEATAAGAPCPHTFKYLNCKKDYAANNNKYPFWYHHFDKQ